MKNRTCVWRNWFIIPLVLRTRGIMNILPNMHACNFSLILLEKCYFLCIQILKKCWFEPLTDIGTNYLQWHIFVHCEHTKDRLATEIDSSSKSRRWIVSFYSVPLRENDLFGSVDASLHSACRSTPTGTRGMENEVCAFCSLVCNPRCNNDNLRGHQDHTELSCRLSIFHLTNRILLDYLFNAHFRLDKESVWKSCFLIGYTRYDLSRIRLHNSCHYDSMVHDG